MENEKIITRNKSKYLWNYMCSKFKSAGNIFKDLSNDNRGVGIVEIILILVILIGLVLIFKDQISQIITEAFSSITTDSESIIQ